MFNFLQVTLGPKNSKCVLPEFSYNVDTLVEAVAKRRALELIKVVKNSELYEVKSVHPQTLFGIY